MVFHTGWSNSAFNPKNWGSSSSSSSSSNTSSTPKIDTDSAVSTAINTNDDGTMATKTYTGSLANDVSMGLSTFGLSGQAQIDKLVSQGWSESAAKDFQARTEETKKNTPPPSNNDDGPSTAAADPEPETEEIPPQPEPTDPTPPPDPDPTPPIVSTPTNPNTGVNTAQGGSDDAAVIRETAEGPAEEKVADTAEKGRRSTIMTTPGGLLTDPNDPGLRRRRSLMGGGLIS